MVISANALVIGIDSQKENEMGVSQEVRKRIEELITPAEALITDTDGNLVLSKPQEDISVNVCQDDAEEKSVTIFSNAPLSRTGLLDFLEWLGNHGYRYNYAAPGISYHNYRISS
ncbi:MAG: hypothetical protein NTX26_01620 [Candidatus Parcubacteria bacterium]|nr:hypothetical protein [Candidatus Parcubacteria bacterium]